MFNRIVKKKSYTQSQLGIGLVEIVVVIGIIALLFPAIFQLLSLSSKTIRAGTNKIEATYLAQEGIEATRTLRNKSWDSEIATLTNDTVYYPVISANRWTLSTINPGIIDGLYTVTVVLSEVFRDGNDDIAADGTSDPNTKKILAKTTWIERETAKEVAIETYITNFLQN